MEHNDLDKFAYHVVCNWPQAIGFNPVHKGIDYSHVIRFYLWDKVGRALRIKHGIDFDEVEVYKKEYQSYPFYHTPMISNGQFKKPIFSRKKLVFIPFHVPHTAKLVKQLKKQKFKILSKETTPQITEKEVVGTITPTLDLIWYKQLHKAVVDALEVLNISLIKEDFNLLKEQIEGSILITDLAFKELKTYKPDALYVHSDNHPPYINYVLVAKQLGAPTFTYQHGLDCEHYYLDDCFADYVGVWSEKRKQAYQMYSQLKPKNIAVIGNLFIEQPVLKEKINGDQTILFITRPHKAIKCYSPSRNHLEGVEILKTLIKFLALNKETKLIIKPHPMDNVELYEVCITESGLEEQIIITNEKLLNLFSKVDVVVTEDSTAGAEAMYYKLPCIHAHFAKSIPVLPFVNYDSAFSGQSNEELLESLKSVFILSNEAIEKMKQCQEHFLKDYLPIANPTDLVNFIVKNI